MTIQRISFKQYLLENTTLLVEAQDYTKLFTLITNIIEDDEIALKNINNSVNKYISMAKELKKNDRIVWFLKYVRIYILNNLINSTSTPKEYLEDLKKLKDSFESQFLNKNKDYKPYSNFTHLIEELKHFYSYNINELNKIVLVDQTPDEIISLFDEILKKNSVGDVKGTIPYEKDLDTIISFEDGYKWVNLNVSYCEKEGSAMGHCGNKASWRSGDSVLSLRKLIKRNTKDKSSWLWYPSLTFILDKNGFLGEMKGRSNEKPIEKYHKYIVPLLENNIVKGIKGGGYLPANNFSLNDLDKSEKERLLKAKPELQKPYKELLQEVLNKNWEVVSVKGAQILLKCNNLLELLDFYDDSGRQAIRYETLRNFLKGDYDTDYEGYYDLSELIYMLDVANKQKIQQIALNSGWDEDEYTLEEYIENEDRELYDTLTGAYSSAYSDASFTEMQDSLQASLERSDWNFKIDYTTDSFTLYIDEETADTIIDEESIHSAEIKFKWIWNSYYGVDVDSDDFNATLKDYL